MDGGSLCICGGESLSAMRKIWDPENSRKKELTPDEKQFVLDCYDKIAESNPNNIGDYYDDILEKYDKMKELTDSRAYERIALQLAGFYRDEDKASKRIIDIGSGTGLFGEVLKKLGFKEIHALDMSRNSLEFSKRRDCYSKYIEACCCADPIPEIAENTYDAAACCGLFAMDHVPLDGVHEMIRMVKSGGYVLYSLYDPHLVLNYIKIHSDVITSKKAELVSMVLAPFRTDCYQDFKMLDCYYVVFRVL